MSCPRTIPCDFSPNLVSSFLFKINSKGSVATYADIVRLPLLFTLNRFLLLFEDSSLWMNFRGDILIFVITKLISCMYFSCCCCFFFIWVFFHEHWRITGLQGRGESISLTPHYHFHMLHRHLDISGVITAESLPQRIASSRTRTGNLWFPSASR